ncbi:MAG: hypothetical protein VX777_08920 [Chlamydiota bacterium]|nr:hypothetical protein [Chlamydiota bacterium]
MSAPIENRPNSFNLTDCSSNEVLVSRIKTIHESFKYIGFDDGIDTAYQVALEALDSKVKDQLSKTYGGKIDRVSYHSFEDADNKFDSNKRLVQIMNAVFFATEYDSLEDMELSAKDIARDFG